MSRLGLPRDWFISGSSTRLAPLTTHATHASHLAQTALFTLEIGPSKHVPMVARYHGTTGFFFSLPFLFSFAFKFLQARKLIGLMRATRIWRAQALRLTVTPYLAAESRSRLCDLAVFQSGQATGAAPQALNPVAEPGRQRGHI